MEMKKLSFIVINSDNDCQIINDCILEYFKDDGKNLRVIKNGEIKESMKFLNTVKCCGITLHILTDKENSILKFKTKNDLIEFKSWLVSDEDEKSQNKILKDLIEDSFHLDMRNHPELKLSSQKYLRNKIKEFLSEYDSNYYGPVSTICQSSGFGKSKACESLANENMFVVFCCLRDEYSIGYPSRSCLAKYLLIDSETESQVINCFKCYFNFFIDLLNGDHKNTDCKNFFEKYNQKDNKLLLNLVEKKFNETTNSTQLSYYTGFKPLIFIFDESSSLLRPNPNRENNYFVLRRFLCEIKGNIFVLFTDTFTNLSEYIPVKKDNFKEKVFEPIYLLPTWDIFVDYEEINAIFDTANFYYICKFGRVLWGSLINTKFNEGGKYSQIKSNEIFELVISKLIGGKNFRCDKLDSNDHLAIFSTRLGMVKPKSVSTSQDLVAKNMAVCLYVSTSENLFEIEYPSEPILSLAGSFLMTHFNPDDMLDDYMSCVESDLISQGEKGETIAKFILIRTIDKILQSRNGDDLDKLLDIIKVGEFIQSLYGKCMNDCGEYENNWICSGPNKKCAIKIINSQIKNSGEFLDGFINFNHFTRAREYLSETYLKKALRRRAAIHCKKLQKGIDLVIPVSLNKNDFNSISSILVQVKLEKKPCKPDFVTAYDAISSKMFYDLASDKPYLLLYMQLGLNSKEPYIENVKDGASRGKERTRQAIIYTEGIGRNIFPNLAKEFLKKLKYFSISESNLFKADKDNQIYDFTKFAI